MVDKLQAAVFLIILAISGILTTREKGENGMNFCDKLVQLRRERGLSQEQLAEILHVTRQSVSKWEAGNATPELAKLIALADIFGVSLDYLARPEQPERAAARPDDAALARELAELRRCVKRRDGYEYRSKTTLFGLPLVHIKISRYGNAVAKGIIAIGNISVGVLSLGGLALGLLSFGGVSLGLLFAFGGCALGGISFGGFSIGALAFGGFAVGIYAIGGSAFAHTLAVGATAMGNAAIGVSARGEQVLMLDGATQEQVRLFLLQNCPHLWKWLVRLAMSLANP